MSDVEMAYAQWASAGTGLNKTAGEHHKFKEHALILGQGPERSDEADAPYHIAEPTCEATESWFPALLSLSPSGWRLPGSVSCTMMLHDDQRQKLPGNGIRLEATSCAKVIGRCKSSISYLVGREVSRSSEAIGGACNLYRPSDSH